MGSSGGSSGNPGMAPPGGRFGSRVPIAGQETPFSGGAGNDFEGPGGRGGWLGGGPSGDAGAMRQQLAAVTGGGGAPWPGNPAPPQAPLPGPTLAQPPPSGGATPAQLATPEGVAPRGGGWMGWNGTGTGDWNYATQGQGGNVPGQYNYAGWNVTHGVGDDPAKGQVSAASMPGQAGYLAKPTGAQGGFLPRPG